MLIDTDNRSLYAVHMDSCDGCAIIFECRAWNAGDAEDQAYAQYEDARVVDVEQMPEMDYFDYAR